jgi:hypothetical protein
MPNYVDNLVTFTGYYHELEPYAYAVSKGKLLRCIKPMSETAEQSANDIWGTKWDVYDPQPVFMRDDHCADIYQLHMQFESAWAPPIGAFEMLNEQNIEVYAVCMESSGLDFAGEYVNGEYRQWELKDCPHHIYTMFQKYYDWDRIRNQTHPDCKVA